MSGIFDPNTHIQTVVIAGCGGTGAQVARIVARILYDMRRARLHTPNLLLIDPDHVEEKNVGRQLYMLRGIYFQSGRRNSSHRESCHAHERDRMGTLSAVSQ